MVLRCIQHLLDLAVKCITSIKSYLTSTVIWGIVLAVAIGMIIAGIITTIFFMTFVNLATDYALVLRKDSLTTSWWAKPPVEPTVKVFIYNVTNADEFLDKGSKPILHEQGPYVYKEKWEKRDLSFHDNGTVSFHQKKIYHFDKISSSGSEDDVVIVPNIPMLSATSQSKFTSRILRVAMTGIMDMLKIQPFVSVSVGQLLWGYDDPLMKFAKGFAPKEKMLPSEEFGLMYNKNGTSKDTVTMFTGAKDIRKYGIIDKFNGMSKLSYYTEERCNDIMGSDGSIFPPHLTKNSTIYVFDKDMCRKLPLVFDKEIVEENNIPGYRFTPPKNVFASVDENPDNICFCPQGPPCAPSGFFNLSICQFDSPILLSFPHFYLADDKYRTAVEGISQPEKEKHQFYIDVQPMMGTPLRAKARIQLNIAVSQVIEIKQVASFPDIIFPILWFEEGLDKLPQNMTNLMKLATTLAPIAHTALSVTLLVVGSVLLIIAIWQLNKEAHRRRSLQLNPEQSSSPGNKDKDVQTSNVQSRAKNTVQH